MTHLYQKDDIVLLYHNRYHLGMVRRDQATSRADVLVEWVQTEPVEMRPTDIILESTSRLYRPIHLEPRTRPLYDLFEVSAT